MDLVVVRPFGAYRMGDRVTDPNIVETILASEHAVRVVRVPPVASRPLPVGKGK